MKTQVLLDKRDDKEITVIIHLVVTIPRHLRGVNIKTCTELWMSNLTAECYNRLSVNYE